jgi:site-specific DNA-cytosine methylase
MLLDARLWVPQSRPRVFVVAVRDHIDTSALEDHGPNWHFSKNQLPCKICSK